MPARKESDNIFARSEMCRSPISDNENSKSLAFNSSLDLSISKKAFLKKGEGKAVVYKKEKSREKSCNEISMREIKISD